MADRKISDLTALTTPASGDYLPIVDISEASAANKNKRITIEELLRGAPDGTAGAPGIAFESDPNTGIYRPGADQVAISTGGTGRLFIDSAGLVGIGTSEPGSRVESRITGGGAAPATSGTSQPNAAFRVSGAGTTGVLDIGCNSSAPWIQSTDRTDLSQKYSLLLNPNGGNVGIGTTSPGAQCDIASSSTYGLRINHATLPLQSFTVNGTQAFTIGANSGGGGSFYYGTGDVEAARVDSSGRLLVGTSSQSGGSLLQVNDNRIRIATAKTPASATDTGVAGEICWDANYVYVCTATNTWKRTAISTW